MKLSPFIFKSKYHSFAWIFSLACLPMLKAESAASSAVVTVPSRGAVGGGWSDAGTLGEYFIGNQLTGSPVFTRREVRIDFDWGSIFPIGGSTAEPYRSFPHDNFSARWTGRLIPRFSESYVFTVKAESKPTLSLKEWGKLTELPLTVNAEKQWVSQPIGMKAGTPVEVVLEYHHATGAANCSLLWSSPSVPLEVIDPVIEQGVNLASFQDLLWADRQKDRRWTGAKEDGADENGEMQISKTEFVMIEASIASPGNYHLSFTGYANVTLFNLAGSKFIVDGKEYDQLTAKGPGYDPKTNKTDVLFKLADYNVPGTRSLKFADAFRDPAGTQPGILDFHMMRPVEKGSATPCALDAVVNPPMRRMSSFFTCLRYLDVANQRTTPAWVDRTSATCAKFYRPVKKSKDAVVGGENWESLVMFANETGRDLYLTTPLAADDEYFHKLALLMKNGSDGVEPYSVPTPNPKYPPLNSNLHLYYEVGNEIWNWGFRSTQQDQDLAKQAVEQNTDDGKIINYDENGIKMGYRRYHAIRTVKASNTFREVFGDSAMHHRIRPLLEFQYANMNETARSSFFFLDAYYNNGDGEHVKDPHPISYYVWGGGGAAYYGVGNGTGDQNEIVLKDASFEENGIGDGEKATPKTGAWTFSGNAGIYRGYSSAVSSYTPSTELIKQPLKTGVGLRFKTGDKPLWVYKLGRVFNKASEKGSRISILKVSDLSLVTKAETGPVKVFVGKIFGYYWAELPDQKPVQLDPNTEYLLVSQDLELPSVIDGLDVPIKPGNQLSNVKSIKVTLTDPANPKSWQVKDGAPNSCGGPITMLYSDKQGLTINSSFPPDGVQAAYINGIGEISQQVDFPKAGNYALNLSIDADNRQEGQALSQFQFYCDEQNASPTQQHNIKGNSDTFHIGGYARNNGFKEVWGSAVFTIDKPGIHTLRFVGTSKNKPNLCSVVLDNIKIASVDTVMESGFGSGSALGQPVENAWGASQAKDSRYGISLGLPRVSYETGWSVGGDFYQRPIQNWCKLVDPRSEKMNQDAINIWKKTGGYLPVWGVYTYWINEDTEHGESCPMMKSFIKASQQLPPEPDNGEAVPAELTDKNCVPWGWGKNPAKIYSWTVICPASGIYKIKVDPAAGGKYSVDFDGKTIGPDVEGGSEYLVQTTKGMHGVLFRCKDDVIKPSRITVSAK